MDSNGTTGYVDVNVTITDKNEFSPEFNPKSYTGSVIENTVAGTSILLLTATDADGGDGGRFYELWIPFSR